MIEGEARITVHDELNKSMFTASNKIPILKLPHISREKKNQLLTNHENALIQPAR